MDKYGLGFDDAAAAKAGPGVSSDKYGLGSAQPASDGIGEAIRGIGRGLAVKGSEAAAEVVQNPEKAAGEYGPALATLTGPDGLGARIAYQGILGGSSEYLKQRDEIKSGKRKSYDLPAIGRGAAWGLGMETVFGGIGKLLTAGLKAGKFAGTKIASKLSELDLDLNPPNLRMARDAVNIEDKMTEQIGELGRKLRLSPEEARTAQDSLEKGLASRESFFSGKYGILDDLNKRYAPIHAAADKLPITGTNLSSAIAKLEGEVRASGKPLSPAVQDAFDKIKGVLGETKVPDSEISLVDPLGRPITKAGQTVAKGTFADLRAAQKYLDHAFTGAQSNEEVAMLKSLNLAAGQDLQQTLVSGKVSPKILDQFKALDSEWGSTQESLGQFARVLGSGRKMSEVGNAFWSMAKKSPGDFSKLAHAADEAGRLPEMREAFVQHVMGAGQVSGGAAKQAGAIRKATDFLSPGAKGQDVLESLGFPKEIGASVDRFNQVVSASQKAQKELRSPMALNVAQRYATRMLIIGGFTGMSGGAIGLSYSDWRKDPGKALLSTMGVLAGIAGFVAATKNPTLARAYSKFVLTNPASKQFFERGIEFEGMLSTRKIRPIPTDPTPSPTNP